MKKEFMHLEKLMKIVEAEGRGEPYACIKDLVENGLSLDRFAAGEQRRQPSECKDLSTYVLIGSPTENCTGGNLS